MIVIVDYGLGNIGNVARAVERLGYDVAISHEASTINKAQAVILPGVGHFKDAMLAIHRLKLHEILRNVKDKPIVGICLGMQLMYEHSDEGNVDGLGLVPGNITLINTIFPVPHLGWNNLISNNDILNKDVYFVHSYQAPMTQHVVAYASYGTNIPAIIQYNNCIGIQFHPEKSGDYGLKILQQALQGGFINDSNMASN
ncbi:imidazole glycerol phosphate synthase subunit HisH [Staphylococcus simiae]|uniref:Imidazole glycerol phosphate synthase subunit HisH n=1 Tax=Staphylococcus simiae CCM 7213 = CCUG 51256 TaxID=911238 RepID=G5JK00_9STAP|nr:imidazole glycerol phosphate synthase subunit HisH [Staphylococcus simiae]EHJ07490.1 imidazole glycerol phosphate synthase subunit HisH [Staphylococcus simiae CCM 7213 = CCUG 51256]PNZ14961.1 imidazole glycerol phosphate synthase subunit HisH [Staphylococcus simiae]SNV84639.1 Imidazole glycerol phosphate synthase amidotransferase subunit [Staphylococcus simiae]